MGLQCFVLFLRVALPPSLSLPLPCVSLGRWCLLSPSLQDPGSTEQGCVLEELVEHCRFVYVEMAGVCVRVSQCVCMHGCVCT